MPDYRLKTGQERFMMVEGPFENRHYEPGLVYPEIPPGEEHRFEEIVSVTPVSRKTKTEKTEAEA